MPIAGAVLFHLSLNFLLLWFLIFRCWPEYRIDRTRQDLFALRDELFDFAADGQMEFGGETYRYLRDLINAMIRFAHRITFSRVVWVLACEAFHPGIFSNPSLELWKQKIEKLPEAQKTKLLEIHARLGYVLREHLKWRTLLTALLVVAFRTLRWPFGPLFGSIKFRNAVRVPVSQLEAQALEESNSDGPRESHERVPVAV